MAAELKRDIAGNGRGHKVSGTVYIECGWKEPGLEPPMNAVGEAEMVVNVHKDNPDVCNGIVTFADLSLGKDVEPALIAFSKNPMVKGIRDSLSWSDDDNVFGHSTDEKRGFDEKFRAGFALLSKYSLSYDCWLFHEQLDALADLAQKFPETTIICDHVGMPLGIGKYSAEKSFEVWKPAMEKLAKNKNVYMKIGGLGMRGFGFGFCDRAKPPTSDELAQAWGPYVNFCIKTFGVDRCMMESNFPVDKISAVTLSCLTLLKRS